MATREELIAGYIAQEENADMKTLLQTVDVENLKNLENLDIRLALSLRGGYPSLLPDDTDFLALAIRQEVKIRELDTLKDEDFMNIVINNIKMTREIVYDLATIYGILGDEDKQNWIDIDGKLVQLTKSDIQALIVGGKNARQDIYFAFRGKVQKVLEASTIEEVETISWKQT